MRLPGIWCAGVTVLALSGCAAPPPLQKPPPSSPVALPPAIGNGFGSQFGNYGGQIGGEAVGPAGQHCRVFNWDRPLDADFAIRYSSLSCDQPDKDWKTTTTYTRTVIPISKSNLAQQ